MYTSHLIGLMKKKKRSSIYLACGRLWLLNFVKLRASKSHWSTIVEHPHLNSIQRGRTITSRSGLNFKHGCDFCCTQQRESRETKKCCTHSRMSLCCLSMNVTITSMTRVSRTVSVCFPRQEHACFADNLLN